jgi:hypothetical protein
MKFGCAVNPPALDLPCRIEAGQTRTLTLKLLATSENETDEIKSTHYLYTTAPGQAEAELTLVGRGNAKDR